jgi:hypothetical protein
MGQDLLLAIKVIQWADPIKNGRTVQKCKYSKFEIFSGSRAFRRRLFH